MSFVTNVILTASDMGDAGELLDEINAHYFAVPGHVLGEGATHSANRGLCMVDEYAGGDKEWPGAVALGAINYLSVEHFIAYLRTLDWIVPASVQLMFCTDNMERFEVVDIFPDDGSEPLTQYQRDHLPLEDDSDE